MPVERNLKTAPDNTRRQFEDYLDKNRASSGQGNRVPLAPEHHELLYSENGGSDQGASLLFDARPEYWLQRQISRREVRNEVARLINAQFGDQALIVERRFLPNETIGDRIMKDSATPSGFSFNRIDDAAMDRIARRIKAVHNAIKTHNGKHPHEEANGEKKPFSVSREMLKTIYQEAREDAPINNEDLPDAIQVTVHEYDDNEPSLFVNPEDSSVTVHSYTDDEPRLVVDPEDSSVTVHGYTDGAPRLVVDGPSARPGAKEFALSQDYRRGMHGKERDRDQGAYYLALAVQLGDEEAQDALHYAAEKGDRTFQRAIARVYCQGRGDVEQDLSEAAYWLARSWQGLKAAHDHTDWVKALYADNNRAPNLPHGALELALSQILLTGAEHLDRNPNKAAYFLLLAAEKGNRNAADRLAQLAATKVPEGDDLSLQLALYQIYRKGAEDTNQDQTQAGLWLARALIEPDHQDRAALHFPQSTLRTHLRRDKNFKLEYAPEEMACDLGRFYKTGHAEIPRDVDKAAYFLALAAETGEFEAGNKEAIAALKSQEGEIDQEWLLKYHEKHLVPNKESDPALQYALYEVYRKGADGVDRSTKKAGPWLARAMRMRIEINQSSYSHYPYMQFTGFVDDGPWEGLPQSIKDARLNYQTIGSEHHDFDLHLWKIYRHGTEDVEQDMAAAVYWLVKARLRLFHHQKFRSIRQKELSDWNTSPVEEEIKTTFDALSWRDFKRYADPAFYAQPGENDAIHRGTLYWHDLRDKLRKAANSGNDPEAVQELARHQETRAVQPPFE